MKSSWPLSWQHFNAQHEETEKHVSHKTGSYQGLSTTALYTSHEDLERIFSHELIQGSFLDLGCGSGETSLYYGSLFPERQSFGIEFEESRLKIGEAFKARHLIKNVTFYYGDLLILPIPEVDTYFLYFPTGPVLDRILTSLYKGQKSFRLVAIESHGDLFPRLDLENWLSIKAEIPLTSPRHHSHARIYERFFESRSDDLYPFTLSYEKAYLLIEEDGKTWIGETFGLEWTSGDRFELLTPPRTISWKNVKKMMLSSDFDQETQMIVKLRREGSVVITTRDYRYEGFIRKIIVKPTFGLEISNGKKIEWKDILTITQGSLLCYDSSSAF
jgi:SAM-dependent methyltransferase